MAMCEAQRFDCVLTDYNMPDMNGVALASELRAASAYLPVILMTGYATLTSEQAEMAGIKQILLKPASLHALGTAVRAVLSPWNQNAVFIYSSDCVNTLFVTHLRQCGTVDAFHNRQIDVEVVGPKSIRFRLDCGKKRGILKW